MATWYWKESYKALGYKHAEEINEILAEKEPFDVQLEYNL